MYLFSVDFSENNLLTETLGIESLYNLPVLNKLLIENQLINFADLSIKKVCLIDCNIKVESLVFNIVNIRGTDLFKELATAENGEKFIAYRNDVYFEIDSLKPDFYKFDEVVSFEDKSGLVFAVTGSIEQLKRLYNKNISLLDILKQSPNFIFKYKEITDGYIKQLNGIKNYKKLLFDILNGRTIHKPPFIAEGVFTDGVIPKGDFSIVPPVYLGGAVQIESGSVVGPNVVVYNNTLISENTTIMNSVLFENVFVSSNCFVDGSVCCDNASIKRNSAVFSDSVIGVNALIGEDMTLENNSVINKNVKYDSYNILYSKNRKKFSLNNKFQGLSPDKTALLGSAVAVVFKEPKIIVGCDGSPNSLCLKLAFMSGLVASGSECVDVGITFKSQMFFSSVFCDCEYSVFFSGRGGGTNIEIFDSENQQLSKTQCCNLFDFCNKGEFVYKNSDEYRIIRQIKGLRRMYVCEITAFSSENLPYIVDIVCENPILLKTLEDIFNRCSEKDKQNFGLTLYMNESGTNVNIKYRGKVYNQKTLKRLVFFFMKRDVYLKVFESDFYKTLWRNDSVFLTMTVLNIIKNTGKNLDILVSELPRFYIKTQSINLKYKDSELAEKISTKFKINHQKGTFNIKCNEGYAKVINNREKGEINIVSSSKSLAVSKEICDFFTKFLPFA